MRYITALMQQPEANIQLIVGRWKFNFRKALLKFMRPAERKFFNINDPFKIRMLKGLRLSFRQMSKMELFAKTVNC